MAKYNKLVRDKIPEILDRKGVAYERKIANSDEYKEELIKKLSEELLEFQENNSPEELADVSEVVMSLQKLADFSNTEEIRKQKKEKRGGFEKRIILKGEK